MTLNEEERDSILGKTRAEIRLALNDFIYSWLDEMYDRVDQDEATTLLLEAFSLNIPTLVTETVEDWWGSQEEADEDDTASDEDEPEDESTEEDN